MLIFLVVYKDVKDNINQSIATRSYMQIKHSVISYYFDKKESEVSNRHVQIKKA